MFNLMCGNTHFTENRIVCLQTRCRSENALADYKYRGGGAFILQNLSLVKLVFYHANKKIHLTKFYKI